MPRGVESVTILFKVSKHSTSSWLDSDQTSWIRSKIFQKCSNIDNEHDKNAHHPKESKVHWDFSIASYLTYKFNKFYLNIITNNKSWVWVFSVHWYSKGHSLPKKVKKKQYVHFRLHANYSLLSCKIPEKISRRSMFFNN